MTSKLYLFISLFLILFNCKKENIAIKKGEIRINEKYIKYGTSNFKRPYIIESKDNSEIYNLKRLMDSGYNLPHGNYKLVYSSFYKMHNEIEFTINNDKTTLDIYPDSLDYSQIKDTKCCLLIDELKPKETLYIYSNLSGCFSNFNNDVKITKKDSNYYIHTNYYKNKKLNAKQLRLLREFEFEIYHLDLSDFFCTTTEKYLFLNSTSKVFISKSNSSCWYYGFGHFMQSLKE